MITPIDQPSDTRFKLTDDEVSKISSSFNVRFEAFAFEMSKRIEEIAKMISDSDD